MMSFIVEPPKICFSSVWTRIRPELLWEKFMKASAVLINRLLKWSGCLGELDFIGLPWFRIALGIIKDAKNVNSLEICNWYPLHHCILSLNHGRSEVGGWILLDKLILHLQRGIASCWLLWIFMTHKEVIEFITEHIIHRLRFFIYIKGGACLCRILQD